jgi:hypothetical protein
VLQALPPPEISFNYLGQLDQTLSESSLFGPARESSGPPQSPLGRRPHLLDVNGGWPRAGCTCSGAGATASGCMAGRWSGWRRGFWRPCRPSSRIASPLRLGALRLPTSHGQRAKKTSIKFITRILVMPRRYAFRRQVVAKSLVAGCSPGLVEANPRFRRQGERLHQPPLPLPPSLEYDAGLPRPEAELEAARITTAHAGTGAAYGHLYGRASRDTPPCPPGTRQAGPGGRPCPSSLLTGAVLKGRHVDAPGRLHGTA